MSQTGFAMHLKPLHSGRLPFFTQEPPCVAGDGGEESGVVSTLLQYIMLSLILPLTTFSSFLVIFCYYCVFPSFSYMLFFFLFFSSYCSFFTQVFYSTTFTLYSLMHFHVLQLAFALPPYFSVSCTVFLLCSFCVVFFYIL